MMHVPYVAGLQLGFRTVAGAILLLCHKQSSVRQCNALCIRQAVATCCLIGKVVDVDVPTDSYCCCYH